MSEPHAESTYTSEGDAGGLQPVQPSEELQRMLAGATSESTPSAANAVPHNTAQREVRRGKVWYAPWTWFRSGSSPQDSTNTTQEQLQGTHTSSNTESPTQGLTKAAHKRLLPEVRMAPLEADQVAQLTAHVKADRQRILDDEEEIHKVLTNIQRARYRYTIPLPELPCQEAVQRVTQCYEECNARHGVTSETNASPGKTRSIVMSDEAHMAYTQDLLGCADVVQALRACVDERLRAYSEADTQ